MGEVVELRRRDDAERRKIAREVNALLMAERFARMLDEARVGYEKALLECDRLGLSPAQIAKQTGRRPDSIRMFLSRKKRKKTKSDDALRGESEE